MRPSAGRFVKIRFVGGGSNCGIAEARLFGRENFPERHLMCWWGDLKRDMVDKVEYLDSELGVTDLWLDWIETAFPQTNHNAGFDMLAASGLLEKLNARGIRYWLSEHEAFTQMVNGPADLRNDDKWQTLFRQMRYLYARAKAMGFRGLVHDAEDYGGVSGAAKEKYKDVADHVDAWCFADEFGYDGHYYRRGLQFGRVMKEVWPVPLLQVYEARMYAGVPGCRDGNYWWLKGICDAGIEIWIATERTYGAGNREIIAPRSPGHLFRWFVDLKQYVADVHKAYPFASRVLPGFHPWNMRTKWPHYLPKYLDEQLRIARDCALGYWVYTEGIGHGGDPRHLDGDALKKHHVTAQQYIKVFQRNPTWRSRR